MSHNRRFAVLGALWMVATVLVFVWSDRSCSAELHTEGFCTRWAIEGALAFPALALLLVLKLWRLVRR